MGARLDVGPHILIIVITGFGVGRGVTRVLMEELFFAFVPAFVRLLN